MSNQQCFNPNHDWRCKGQTPWCGNLKAAAEELPLPIRVQQETMRANGRRGEVSLDTKWLCVKPAGHDGQCGDEQWPRKEPEPEPYNEKELWIINEIFSGDPDQMAYKIRSRADYLFPNLTTRFEDDDA